MNPISYEDSGVSIDRGNEYARLIKNLMPSMSLGFSGEFDIPEGYSRPVLVASTDGVGTKIELARLCPYSDSMYGIGLDLVATVVNDITVDCAKPLFFLDYFATGHLNPDDDIHFIRGVVDGCRTAEMTLLGGETAEMPGVYEKGKFDLAGFAVGIKEKNGAPYTHLINEDTALIALGSSGFHSNGYSLIRKVLATQKINPFEIEMNGRTILDRLLSPTVIYHPAISAVMKEVGILGLANITGGGLVENVPRMLPEGYTAIINVDSWEPPQLFTFFQNLGNIRHDEMFRVFNMGVGMVLAVPKASVSKTIEIIRNIRYSAWEIGEVIPTRNDFERIIIA